MYPIYFVEYFKNTFPVCFRNSNAIVDDVDFDDSFTSFYHYVDLSSVWCKLKCIGEKIGKNFLKLIFINGKPYDWAGIADR
ncbi:hypothetical protein D3C79_854120 [compost metagenome]